MGVDGATSGSVSRGGLVSASDVVHPLSQCLSLELNTLGIQKYTFSVELRRALDISLGCASEDHPFRIPSYKASTFVATEEIKQFKENVQDALISAMERSKLFGESLYKLDKYMETMGSKKRQRSDFLSNEKPGGSSLLKIVGQPPRNLLDRSAQRVEDKAGSANMNKRFRSSAVDIRVDSKSSSSSKNQINNEKEIIITKPMTGVSVQPDERIRRFSTVGEGWDKTKRKRSTAIVTNRCTDNEVKGSILTKFSGESKLAPSDACIPRSNANQGMSITSSRTVIKGKFSRVPRNGLVNSFSDNQASLEACEGREQPTSTNKVMSLGLMQNHHRVSNSSHSLGGWGGQRQQKSSRSRRTMVVSPVANQDEGQTTSVSFTPPDNGARISLNGTSGSLESVDVPNNTSKSKLNVESAPSPGQFLDVEETRSLEHKVEEKQTGYSDAILNGKGKVRAFQFPTKRNKNTMHENTVDGVRRQGRTMRGLSSKAGDSQCEAMVENVSMVKPVQNMRLGSEKIRSKSGRPPSRKMLPGRIVTRTPESDDDHEELLAAAAAARKASDLSCSGRFWKKMEPIFGPVSLQDASYLKQQLGFAEELEGGLSHTVGTGYNVLGICMQKERINVSSGNFESHSYQVVDKGEGFLGERKSDKLSSLYQRVLSALIEEDECDGVCNGNEGASLSFQCASDDSHCGSCNYADAETRDRDRLESEAESIIDFQIQKRGVGDRFSCNKSVTSNRTRNVSMSDSLHSSGRWLGDDGLSHSDVEFVSGNFQNDQGVQVTDLMPGPVSNCQYQLMCVDDRLILELQSIGLCLETMPDLAGGEELINQDITELKEGLCEQVGKKKLNLVKIEKAIQNDKDREKEYFEQVAMEQLIQMAYKRRMACRRNNTSKTVMRKVSKQVAMGFIERTLARCKTYELTGRSCFREPALQNIMFAPPQRNDTEDSTSQSMLGSCIDDPWRAPTKALQTASHSSEKDKKRELSLDDVGGPFSRGTTGLGTSIVRGAKGKRSERERERRATPLTNSTEKQSIGRFRGEQNQSSKPLQNSASAGQSLSSSIQPQNTGRNAGCGLSSSVNAPVEDLEEEDPIDFSSLPMPDFDSIEQLGISNDPNVTQDIGFWFDGLQEDGSEGLHIPMDDLSMINL